MCIKEPPVRGGAGAAGCLADLGLARRPPPGKAPHHQGPGCPTHTQGRSWTLGSLGRGACREDSSAPTISVPLPGGAQVKSWVRDPAPHPLDGQGPLVAAPVPESGSVCIPGANSPGRGVAPARRTSFLGPRPGLSLGAGRRAWVCWGASPATRSPRECPGRAPRWTVVHGVTSLLTQSPAAAPGRGQRQLRGWQVPRTPCLASPPAPGNRGP